MKGAALKLQQLIKKLALLEQINGRPAFEISGIVSDSRRARAGSLFVACPGPKTDGHLYFQDAYQRGCRVWMGEKTPAVTTPADVVFLRVSNAREALAQLLGEFYGYPAKKLSLIGITGTNGKTTIAFLLNHLLGLKTPSGYIGTLGYSTPNRKGLLSNTTPGSEELFSILDQMVKEKIRHVAMEVSSHALDQRRVHGMEFELAVFTQLTPEHMDYHLTLEDYFQAKRLLFNRTPRPKRMLINQDSPYGRRLLAENRQAKSFSIQEEATYRARDIQVSLEGSEFIFDGPRGNVQFKSRLPFLHNVSNLTAVLGSLDQLGFDPKDFQEPLAQFTGVPGRLERINGRDFSVFIDYAHTPDAFENVLSEAKKLSPNRILTLFGCGGDRDPYKRPEMTRIAYHYSDYVILTSDNPRSEDPAEILRQMHQGLPVGIPLPNVLEIPNRRDAISEMLALAEPGDVLFILGKGHEDYQIIGDQKIHFDDREVVRQFLERRSRVAI